MKKTLKILLVVLALIMGLVLLTGCGDDEKEDKKADLSKYAGTYIGSYTKLVGDETKNEEEEFSLELKADGTGTHKRDDSEYDVTWKLNGEKFKMTETFAGMSIDYTGTLKDGKLDIFNGDPEDIWTYEYVYEIAE